MEYNKLKQYLSGLIAILILFLFFVPSPKIINIPLIWLISFLFCFITSNSIGFAIFIATSFAALLIIVAFFTNREKNFRQIFIEQFENKKEPDPETIPLTKSDSNDLLIDSIKEEAPTQIMQKDIIKENKKISMMDDDDDFFGTLNLDDLEESDEDSDTDEKDQDSQKKVGKSKISSKEAYKGQKQLYDLNVTINKLTETMKNLGGPLKKGQKIIESLEKLGINKFS